MWPPPHDIHHVTYLTLHKHLWHTPTLLGGLFKQNISHHSLCLPHCCVNVAASCFSSSTTPPSTCRLRLGGGGLTSICITHHSHHIYVIISGGVTRSETITPNTNLFYCFERELSDWTTLNKHEGEADCQDQLWDSHYSCVPIQWIPLGFEHNISCLKPDTHI